MAHDGQDLSLGSVILPDLLDLTRAAVAPVEQVFESARGRVRDMVSVDGRVSGAAVEANQTAAHGLAWFATYLESLRQMMYWADKLTEEGSFGEVEQLIHQIAFGEYFWLRSMGGIPMSQGEILRLAGSLALEPADDMRALMVHRSDCHADAIKGNSQAARTRLVELMQERSGRDHSGQQTGLDDELEMIREQFRRYAAIEQGRAERP